MVRRPPFPDRCGGCRNRPMAELEVPAKQWLWLSETVFETHLNLSRRFIAIEIRLENGTKILRTKRMGRNVEVGMVQQIEELTAELQAMALAAERDTFGEREIDIGIARTGENVAPFGAKSRAKSFLGRRGERALV